MNLPSHFLLLDTETSGLDSETDHLVEVAGVLFDTTHAKPVRCMSSLVAAPSNPAAAINRIPESMLRQGFKTPKGCGPFDFETGKRDDPWLHRFLAIIESNTDPVYLAHNAEFDRKWLDRAGIQRNWICTLKDASWPWVGEKETGTLAAIALAYDVGILRAHRAIEDCLTLAAILGRVHQIEGGLEPWWARAIEKKVRVVAQVSFDQKDLAKKEGFAWDPDRKEWWKEMRISKLQLREKFPFRTILR